jgi:lysophospholipase L1-like esterase
MNFAVFGRVTPPFRFLLAAMVAALVLAACSSPPATSPSAPTSSTSKTSAAQSAEFYVSLGDSYAAGYQPTGPHSGMTDMNGFAYQVPRLAIAKGFDFKLVNFGCGGATTASIIDSVGCPKVLLGPGATPYPGQTQAAAAEAFLRSHRGHVGLITVSISGNDVTACASAAQPVSCVATAIKTIKKNMRILLSGVRSAAGPSVQIVGTTYPDVILGTYLSKTASSRSLAELSVTAFKDLINPTLKAEYASVGGDFVDVTAATGAYGPLTQMTDLPPYGEIPVPVAKVCELTFFCQYHDIHPRTPGYTIIAKLIVGALPNPVGD